MAHTITLTCDNAAVALSALDSLQQLTTGRRPLTTVEKASLIDSLSRCKVADVTGYPWSANEAINTAKKKS